MSKVIHAISTRGEAKKIHYMDSDDGTTYCGIYGPFREVKITYTDRIENRVCKTCMKKHVKNIGGE